MSGPIPISQLHGDQRVPLSLSRVTVEGTSGRTTSQHPTMLVLNPCVVPRCRTHGSAWVLYSLHQPPCLLTHRPHSVFHPSGTASPSECVSKSPPGTSALTRVLALLVCVCAHPGPIIIKEWSSQERQGLGADNDTSQSQRRVVATIPEDAGYMEIDPGSVEVIPAVEQVRVRRVDPLPHPLGLPSAHGDPTS
jgi:hypothetical protein